GQAASSTILPCRFRWPSTTRPEFQTNHSPCPLATTAGVGMYAEALTTSVMVRAFHRPVWRANLKKRPHRRKENGSHASFYAGSTRAIRGGKNDRPGRYRPRYCAENGTR